MNVEASRHRMINVVSPADGRLIGAVADLDGPVVAERIAALREAQGSWEGLRVSERARWVGRYRDWLLDNQENLHRILQNETGKPWGQASMEVAFACHHLNYYVGLAARHLGEKPARAHSVLAMGKHQYVRHRPYPVVGVISPWNFPIAISLIDSIPALLAGAAVALKPSEATPLAVRSAVEGWTEIGAPPVFELVTGGPAAGEAMVSAVDFVQFTGSTRTGRKVAAHCAERLIPCSLELGGKDAMIVLDGADLDRAANAAVWGGLANSGQMCTSVERIYVERSVYEPFVQRVVDAVHALRVGHDDHRARFDIGPLATPQQVELVRRHLEDAEQRGATILTGGTISGSIVDPTVLVDVDHDMACLREETFGPLLPIMAVDSAEVAVAHANSTHYGLSAHLFGPNRPSTLALAHRMEAGAVNINDVAANLSALALPQSGWRQSGLGARNGAEHGLLKYCRTQAVVVARFTTRRDPTWFPYSRRRVALTARLLRWANARDLRRRLGIRPGPRPYDDNPTPIKLS